MEVVTSVTLIEHAGGNTTTGSILPDNNANNLAEEDTMDNNVNEEAASEDSGLSSVISGGDNGVVVVGHDNNSHSESGENNAVATGESLTASVVGHHNSHNNNNHHHHHHGGGGGGLLVMPTSPISVTTVSMSASDDMIENENEMLRDRVADLEKRVHDQNDEITCLRATLADCLRRINSLEANKSHVQVSNSSLQQRLRRGDTPDHKTSQSGMRRPMSGSYSSHDFGAGMTRAAHEAINRRASYASNRDRGLTSGPSLYQSTSSLHNNNNNHNDGQSSTSMSPAPSPSPTTHGPMRRMSPGGPPPRLSTPQRPSSAAMIGSGGLHKRWSSTSDFRELSPAPGSIAGPSAIGRRGVGNTSGGSLASLRSPFGSQQNLNNRQQQQQQHGRHSSKEVQFSPEDGILRFYLGGRLVSLPCPSAQLDSYSLARVNPAPVQKLRLEWVYGYRGRDARANLQLLPTGEMVYFIAAVVVLYNVEEQNQRHYLGHTQDIKCMSVHPNRLLIATGQAGGGVSDRPHIRVWNSVSLQTMHILGAGDFERPICCLSFSKADGGNLLVAVDEVDHNISVWDWQRSDKGHRITETKCSTETVVAAEFHPLDGTTIVTVGKGFVNFWLLDPTTLTLSRKTGIFDQRDKPKYVTCLAFSFTGDVITGDSNGNVFIWGRGYNAVTKVMRKIHDGPIFSICVLKDGSVITGGGKDSRIVKFDTMYRKIGVEAQLPEHLGSIRIISQGRGSQLLLGTTRNSILSGNFELNFQEIMVGHTADVWALATSPSSPQFISAGHDRMIHLWDVLTHSVVWSNDVGEQAQSATFSPDGEVIVVGTVTGKWVVLDINTREVFGVHQDGGEPVHVVKFSPDGSLLAIGSRDNAIYMYQVKDNYRKYNRLGRCMGHSAFVTQLDWSLDSQHLQSNSADNEVLYWTAAVCRPLRDLEAIRDIEWASADCPLSWAGLGLWGEAGGPDGGAGVMSAARCHDLLAAGDAAGRIKLYASPACQPKSLHHTYSGHGAAVTRLAWLADSHKLISTGGKDTAILQWNLLQPL